MAVDAKAKRVDEASKRTAGIATTSKGTVSFLAGSSAGLVSSLALQPFEVIKTRMQAHKLYMGPPTGMFATASCVVRNEGVRGLWAGVTASCVRTAAGAGLYFFLLERVTRELNHRFPKKEGEKVSAAAEGARMFTLGAASRGLAATLLCPITVVKTRMEYAAMSGATYTGVGNALWQVARKGCSAGWARRSRGTRRFRG
jgi:solute carrier family 25 protein 38